MHLRKYGESATIDFELFEVDGVDFRVDAVHAAGDTVIMRDEAAEVNTTNGFVDEGTGYSITLTAAEMQAARIVVYVVDQTATKVWLDRTLIVETYGNASAQHAFDLDTATQDVNAIQISGDATAADNLELMYDGTGYTADTAPASRAQVDGIGAASGGSLNFGAEADNTGGAIKGVAFVGVQTGTFANTEAEDGVYHVIDDTANAIDIVYQFGIGGARTGVEVTFKGYLDGANDQLNIQVYDFVGADWETIGTLNGQAGTTNITQSLALLSKHTGTAGADLGDVLVRFQNTGQSNPQLNVDQLLVAAVNIGQSVGYANGAIWVDTNASNTNTESFVDGVADNPVSTWAAAVTISGNVGINRFEVAAGSSITLTGNSDAYQINGPEASLALGGQSIEGIIVRGMTVTGTGTATTTPPEFDRCSIGTATLPPAYLYTSGFTGTWTMGSAGNYFLVDCYSQVAGAGSPIIDMGAGIGATSLSVRRFGGGLQLNNLAAGDVVSAEATVGGTLTLNGADASVEVRGGWKQLMNNLTGSPTVSDVSVNTRFDTVDTNLATVDTNVDAILVDTADMQPKLGTPVTTISGDIASVQADTDDVQTRLPAALVGGRMSSDVGSVNGTAQNAVNLGSSTSTIVPGEAQAGTLTTTQMTTNLTEATDDHYIGRIIIWTTGNLTNQATDITDYTGVGGLLTFTAVTEAPVAGDDFIII